jgi:RNA polymerase primary sigma factor
MPSRRRNTFQLVQKLLDRRGYVTLDELLRLSMSSPVDPETAAALAESAGIELTLSESNPWDDVKALADIGADTFRIGRQGLARIDPAAEEAVTAYLREISVGKLLTAEEEVMLAQRMEAGREARDRLNQGEPDDAARELLDAAVLVGEAARLRMIESNLRLVVSVARKYLNRGLSFLDLVQEGNIGLQKGVERYDWRKGFRFSTYAYWWIRQAVGRAVTEQGRTIRLPTHVIELLSKVYNAARELQVELSRPPTHEEIARRLGVETARVKEAFQAAQTPMSLEKPIGDDAQSTLGDLIADMKGQSTVEAAEENALSYDLNLAISKLLTPREASLVRMRFGLEDGGNERTLGEVGSLLGVSRERARQIEGEALRKLRRAPAFRRQFGEDAA